VVQVRSTVVAEKKPDWLSAQDLSRDRQATQDGSLSPRDVLALISAALTTRAESNVLALHRAHLAQPLSTLHLTALQGAT
jgi:hypothetical protein